MHKIQRLAAAGVFAFGALAIVPQAAQAAPTADCSSDSIFQDGSKAYYQECYDGIRVRVNGWVEDTDADGQCAFFYVNINNGYTETWKACPKNTRTTVDTGWQVASHAWVSLYEK